jgi:hypothetical protein
MNMIEIQDKLKNFSEEQLVSEMQNPSGTAPQFLVLTEINRRKKAKAQYEAGKPRDQTTVAEDVLNSAGVPSGGLGDIARAMAPKSAIAQNTGYAEPTTMDPGMDPGMAQMAGPMSDAMGGPMQEPVRMAEGGIVVRNGRRYIRQEDGSLIDEASGSRTMTPRQSLERDLRGLAGFPARVRQGYLDRASDPYGGLYRSPESVERMMEINDPQGGSRMSTRIDPNRADPYGGVYVDPSQIARMMDINNPQGGMAMSLPPVGPPRLPAQTFMEDWMMMQGEPGVAEPSIDPYAQAFIDPARIQRMMDINDPLGGNRMSMPVDLDLTIPDEAMPFMPGPDAATELRTPRMMDAIAQGALPIPMPENPQGLRMMDFEPIPNPVEPAPYSGPSVSDVARSLDQYYPGSGYSDVMRGGPRVPPGMPGPEQQSSLPSGDDLILRALAEGPQGSADIPPELADMARERLGLPGVTRGDFLTADKAVLPKKDKGEEAGPAPVPGQSSPDGMPMSGLGAGSGGGGGGGSSSISASGSFAQELEDALARSDKRARQDKWLALARAGMALMSSKEPTFGGALGEAGAVGLDAFQQSRDRADEERLKLREAQFQLSMAQRAAAGRGGSGGLSRKDIIGELKYLDDAIKSRATALGVMEGESLADVQDAWLLNLLAQQQSLMSVLYPGLSQPGYDATAP